MSDAISSFGTLLQTGDGGSPESFTTIAKVRDIGGPKITTGTEETTDHDSPAGWAEFLSTIHDGGEITFELNYLPTDSTHNASTGLIADQIARTKRNFKIVLPDTSSSEITFAALVTNYETMMAVNGVLRANVTLKVSGVVTMP